MTIKRTPFAPDFTEFAKNITVQEALSTYDNVVCMIADYHKWIITKIDQHLQEAKEDETHPRYAFLRKFNIGDIIKFKLGRGGKFAGASYKITCWKVNQFEAIVWTGSVDGTDTEHLYFQYEPDAFELMPEKGMFGTPPATPMIGFKE